MINDLYFMLPTWFLALASDDVLGVWFGYCIHACVRINGNYLEDSVYSHLSLTASVILLEVLSGKGIGSALILLKTYYHTFHRF